MPEAILIIESIVLSTSLYAYLHKKTKISLKHLYIDNIAVIVPVLSIILLLNSKNLLHVAFIAVFMIPAFTVGLAFIYTMIRFWRTPARKVVALENEIISPADGNVIYIKKVEIGDIPVSIKKGRTFRLSELTKTKLVESPCWLIGINMTLFDVHKNCAPIKGEIILNQHFDGKFLSLKTDDYLLENERNTYVIKGENIKVGVVQIASRLVRRIDSYVKEGDSVQKGDWLGMIRFGSQVDVILPEEFQINVKLGQQIYVGKTIIAQV